MQRLAVFLLIVFLLLPISAWAQDTNSSANSSQTANAAAKDTNPGAKDICYNENTYLKNDSGSKVGTDGTVTVKNYSKGPNFQKCEDQKITKTDCKISAKKALVGTVTYKDLGNKSKTLNRCDTLAGENTYCIGDSNCANMQLYTDVTGGNPVYGAKPGQVTDQALSTAIDDPENAKVMVSPGCTNIDPSTPLDVAKSNCEDELNKQIHAIKDKGVQSSNIYCMGSGGRNFSALDDVTAQVCEDQGAQLLNDGKLPVANPGEFHATAQGYQDMAKEVGSFEQAPDGFNNFDGTGAQPNTLSAPLKDLGANDQIRAIANSACKDGVDCSQFGNNMIATFGAECSGKPNCARSTTNDIFGSFQQTTDNYNKGLNAYLQNADTSSEAYQEVQSTCVNGAADRMTHICSTASAVGMHMNVESLIQSQVSDPSQQAAAHMLYQIAPGQFLAGSVDNINDYTLSNASRTALCQNKVCLQPGATGADAISALAGTSNIATGIRLAGSGSSGAFVQAGPAIAGGNPLINSGDTVVANNGVGTLFNGKIYSTGYGNSPTVNIQNAQLVPVMDTQGRVTYAVVNPNSLGGLGGLGGLGALGGNNSLAQMMMLQRMMNPNGGGLFGTPTTATTQTTPTTPPPPPPPPPTVSISALPNPARRGQQVTVTWSSNGTLVNFPCVIRNQDGMTIGQGGSGTQTIATGSSTPPTLTFSAYCYGVNGQTTQQSASVTVQ